MIQSAKDIMAPVDMIKVSIEDDASDVSERVLSSGRIALVKSSGQASAILSLKGSRRLVTQPGSLSDHYPQLRIIGQALPNASVIDIAHAWAFDPTVDAFVVMEADEPAGLITMHGLFKAISPSRFPTINLPRSFVNPPSDPGVACYCCPKIPHQVPPGNIKKGPNRIAFCPTHHNQHLILKVPCKDC
jgi:hypothetical protein